MGTVANFVWFLGVVMILSVLLRSGSNTSSAINSTSNLITNSIKAAKS